MTGASRGYGRALSLEFARSATAPTTLVLLARSEAGLAATRAAVLAVAPGVLVRTVPLDLSDLAGLPAAWAGVLEQLPAVWSRAYLLHNAGGAGRVGSVRSQPLDAAGVAALRATMDLDLLSPWLLTTLFLQAVEARAAPALGAGTSAASAAASAASARSVIVTVSSLAAVAPFATLAPYSVTRSARDMLARVVGVEEGARSVATLNWAPGPMDSELQREIRGAPACDAGIRDFFTDMAAKGTFVDMATSAALCTKLVRTGAFESGAHLDYYDCIEKA